MDLRFRLLLRQYLANQTPDNAQLVLNAAIRSGIIPVEQEPVKALFSDMAVGYGDWDEMSAASQEYIRAHDTSSEMFRKNYLIIIDQVEQEGGVALPPELETYLDAACAEGYSFLHF